MSRDQRSQRLTDWLNDMLDAIRLARRYVEGIDKTKFLDDRKTQQAVILNLLILGEAATRIATTFPSCVERHTEVPWQQMRGMRNRMAHGYFDIDLDIVWETVQESLPVLERQLVELLNQEPPQ